ncbi:MAG: 5'/3'-nucleotidase SurE [Cyanobacteria bacterium NC_groundwater_1444_Ag_S-0.65um_54_12]|nr:5'/3'-nucleotidase SurE [Cyanobacteria bacterium NC_groundwater_1444_Ag_S-0.65um_54_12]
MRLLLSNDDGIHAPGLQVLATMLATEHDVHVVAPDRERSGTGHALTLHKPLRVEEVPLVGVAQALAVNGTPSDCIKLAWGSLMRDNRPDMVVSGINRGPNLGVDVIYSGTVSAAIEGTIILDRPSIAISLASFSDLGYEKAALVALVLVRHLAKHSLDLKVLLNVNVPAIELVDIAGVRTTRLGKRRYNDRFERRIDPRGKIYYWLAGEAEELEEADDTDVAAIRDNCVSITPIHYDLTHFASIPDIENWQIKLPTAFPLPLEGGRRDVL